ncbi:MAG: STAS domain-containing protein [Candidatus Electrothrix sp.]
MDLEIIVRSEAKGRVTVVQASGFIDGKTAPDFQGKILEVLQEVNTILIDLAQVGFMSSAGLRAMLVTHQQAQQAQQAEAKVVALAGLSESIRDNMEATGFLPFFQVFDSIEIALKELG